MNNSIALSPRIYNIEIFGNVYNVWEEAGRYHLKATSTGKVRTFTTMKALNTFAAELKGYLKRKRAGLT